jgi:hypothetical protein
MLIGAPTWEENWAINQAHKIEQQQKIRAKMRFSSFEKKKVD